VYGTPSPTHTVMKLNGGRLELSMREVAIEKKIQDKDFMSKNYDLTKVGIVEEEVWVAC